MVLATTTVPLTSTVVVAVTVAALLIGLAKGGLPGLGPLVTVVVALAVPSKVALGVLLPLLMVGDVVALSALWRHVERSVLPVVLPGAAVSITVASLLLSSLSGSAVEWSLAVIVVAFAAHRLSALLRPGSAGEGPDRFSALMGGRRGGLIAGAGAGITSTLAHAGGPPVAMHLLSRRLSPVRYAATSAALFWAINWMKVPGYAAAGLFEPDLLLSLAPTAVAILPGVLIGRWVVERIPQRPFELAIVVGLLIGVIVLLAR